MATRMLVVAASMVGVTLLSSVDAAPVLGRAAPSPPGGRNTDGGPGMGENYTCSDQYSGQFGHSPCVLPALRRAATSLLSLSGALGCDLELRAHHAQWSFVLCVPGIARELSQLALLPRFNRSWCFQHEKCSWCKEVNQTQFNQTTGRPVPGTGVTTICRPSDWQVTCFCGNEGCVDTPVPGAKTAPGTHSPAPAPAPAPAPGSGRAAGRVRVWGWRGRGGGWSVD